MDSQTTCIWYTRNQRAPGPRISTFRKKIRDAKECPKSRTWRLRSDSFQEYARFVFTDSLVTGLPQIAQTKTWGKKFRKILVLLLCLTGFLYQAGDFLQHYWMYPTVTYVEHSIPNEIVKPALTFCSNNQIRRQVYCERNNGSCVFYKNHTLFCQDYPLYCRSAGKTFHGVPTQEGAEDRLNNFSWEWANAEAPTKKMIELCIQVVDDEDEWICKIARFPFVSQRKSPTFCYTIESQLNNPYSADEVYRSSFEYEFHLYTFPDEYFFPTDEVVIYAAVHNRRHLVNPYKEGIELKGGYQYNVLVSMREDIRLPFPYTRSTNCTDYLDLWNKNNGTGPLNEQACIEYCQLEKMKLEGLCIEALTWYAPHLEKLCNLDEETLTYEMITECGKNCQPACREEKYEVRYDEISARQSVCKPFDSYCNKQDIWAFFIFRKFRLSRHVVRPKYESFELFSFIGGYMGMWLGTSLVSIFDLMESFLYLMYYPFKTQNFSKRKII